MKVDHNDLTDLNEMTKHNGKQIKDILFNYKCYENNHFNVDIVFLVKMKSNLIQSLSNVYFIKVNKIQMK